MPRPYRLIPSVSRLSVCKVGRSSLPYSRVTIVDHCFFLFRFIIYPDFLFMAMYSEPIPVGAAAADSDDVPEPIGATVRPLMPTLVTFSSLPKPRWMNLIHQDAIKVKQSKAIGERTAADRCMSSYARHDITLFASVVAAKPRSDEREPPMSTSAPGPQAATMQERNKPIEPPKAPAEAPFFLRTIPGADPHPRLP